MLQGETIVVTGATGQVGLPVAKALAAAGNEVIAGARFSSKRRRAALEEAGVRCVEVDLANGDAGALPSDPTYVLNFAVAKTNDWPNDLAANADAVGVLMGHCRRAKAVLHCSTTAVYQPDGHRPLAEADPLGDHHRVSPFLQTYSITKIAGEAVARASARLLDLPTTIARLSVPYGDHGGWPAIHLDMMLGGMAIEVSPDPPSVYNPIHEDDVIAQLPRLLEIASVPATTLNWGGDDVVSVEEWCAYLTELTGVEAKVEPGPTGLPSAAVDVARQHELVGRCTVPWRDGVRRMVEARHPELLT